MRILLIGAVQFSAHVLEKLISMRVEVVGVCTLSKSSFHADHVNLIPIANQAGIPAYDTPNINSSKTFEWISSRTPDVIFCFGWSHLIRPPLLKLSRLGVIGFHPAALPANRGRHPIIWALVLGLKETASSFFFMDESADTGDLLSQVNITIYPTDNAGSLYKRITEVALEQIKEFVPLLANGSYERKPQLSDKTNIWRKRSLADGRIDWRMAAESIHNLVRGLSRPYIGAHFDYEDQAIKIWRTRVETNVSANFEPGKILTVNRRGVLVKTGIGAIWLCEFEPMIFLNPGDYL